jgi:predicted ATPase
MGERAERAPILATRSAQRMLTRIEIRGYKSFRQLDFNLRPITVIMGPNAVGKSNFLDAVYLVSRLATSKTLKDAFDGHRGLPLESFYYGGKGFAHNLKQEWLDLTFVIDVMLSDSVVNGVELLVATKRKGLDETPQRKVVRERYLRYTVALEISPQSGYLRIKDERLEALRRDNGQLKKSRNAFVEKVGERIHLSMEGQAHPVQYQVGLEHTVVSTSLYEPHYPHIVAFRRELERWQTFYLEPKTLMREGVPVSEVTTIGPKGENLAAFINTVKQDRVAFANLNKTLREVLPGRPSIDVVLSPEGRVELVINEGGNTYSARLISEGTLRVIGLIAAVHPKSPTVLVGYEEPENGVHPVRLQKIAMLLKNIAKSYGKQIIITTHSPLLPEYFDNDDLFVSAKDGESTTIEPFSALGPLFKKQAVDGALKDKITRGDLGG